ncbi:MAG: hypothetical protein H0X51_08290 [Parachlamydiaceae bacterium]|nr:hypothetical protein [Parachlamydiaceae bacterium]
MMRYLFLLVSLLFLSGCSHSEPMHDAHYEDRVLVNDDADDVSQIIWDLTTEFKYEHDLHLEHSYLCAGKDHTTIRIEMRTQLIIELCEARQLIVDFVEELLDRINNSPVSMKLSPTPFTAEHLEISIDFESYFGRYIDPLYIGWVDLEGGIVYYYAFTVKGHRLDNWHSRYEPYFLAKSFATFRRDAEERYHRAHPTNRQTKLKDVRYQPL